VKVLWTPVAAKSLRETVKFITELWDSEVADKFLNQLDYRIKQIVRNPEIAPSFKNSEFRQIQIHKLVSLFYKSTPDYLRLLLVWDNRQDPSQLFKKLTDSSIQ